MTGTLAINGGTPVRQSVLPLTVPSFDEQDAEAVAKSVRSTFVSGDGPECRAFERELAAYLNVRHAFFTVSCTAALDLAYMVKGFPRGSEVIVPNFTFTSTALAPILNDLRVALVDVDAETGNIDVDKIEAAITERTVALSPVDYAGNPVETDRVNELARQYGLYVVHDIAQSIGAEYKGRKTGSLADVSCLSFHGTKNLAVGEGGAIVTDQDELAKRIIVAREKGTDKYSYLSDPKKKGYYEYVSRGNSYVQSDILAALGRSQLRKVDSMNKRREQIARYYFGEFGRHEKLKLPKITAGAKTNWHLFFVLVPPKMREWFIDALRAEGIMANRHYSPLHINRYYRDLCASRVDEFPESMRFFESLVRLPMYSGMSDRDVEDVAKAVHKLMEHSIHSSAV